MAEIPLIMPLEKGTRFSTLDELAAHVKRREIFFHSRLRQLSLRTAFNDAQGWGWERVYKYNNLVLKNPASWKEEDSIFTGSGFCIFASTALKNAIHEISAGITVSTLAFYPYAFEENKKANLHNRTGIDSIKHIIVEASQAEKTVLFDPTYGQINHRFGGGILIVDKEDMGEYYTVDAEEPFQYDSQENIYDIYPMGMTPDDMAYLTVCVTR